jgi:hypothetical protein
MAGDPAVATRFSIQSRRQRQRLREQLQTRQVCVGHVLRHPPEAAQGMRAFEVLELAPGLGRTKVARLNVRAAKVGVNLMRPLGNLTERQREWLARVVTRP